MDLIIQRLRERMGPEKVKNDELKKHIAIFSDLGCCGSTLYLRESYVQRKKPGQGSG